MDDIDCLTALLPDAYPLGVRSVAPSIPGPAFFPGGTGVVVGDGAGRRTAGRTLPRGGVLILGHNFHNVENYEASLRRGREDEDSQTWRNLGTFLDACGLDVEACFLTNALMGLIEGESATGSVAGHRDPAFRQACRRVFEESVARQQPRLILVLGLPAARFLGETVPGLAHWQGVASFRQLDAVGAVARDVLLPGCPRPAGAVGLIHPCLRRSNLRHRRGWAPGADPEVGMVEAALRA